MSYDDATGICPVCQNKSDEAVNVSWSYHDDRSEKSWQYFRCVNCGCYFLDAMRNWTPEMYAREIYNEDYVLCDKEFGGERSRRLAPEIMNILHRNRCRTVLDYGGGKGILADILRQNGLDAYCYDSYGRQDISADGGIKFDSVLAIEVLEHEIHACRLWGFISGILKAGGIFIATTEVCDNHDIGNWFYANPRAGHTLLYSGKGLSIMAERYGLRRIMSSCNKHVFQKTGAAE